MSEFDNFFFGVSKDASPAPEPTDSEKLFNKNFDELSDMERLMLSIILEPAAPEPEASEAGNSEVTEPAAGLDAVSPAPEAEPAVKATDEETKVYIPPAKFSFDNAEAGAGSDYRGKPAVQYIRNVEREKQISREAARRRTLPVTIILVVCIVMVIGAILANIMMRDKAEREALDNAPDFDMSVPVATVSEPEAEESSFPFSESRGPVVFVSDSAPQGLDKPESDVSQPDNPQAPSQPSYQLFIEDVGWLEARDRCIQMGGHLVVINDETEFAIVTVLAEEAGIEKLWVGCHRVNGVLIWEGDGEVVFNLGSHWGRNEPSYYDKNDNVAEDYLLLWLFNGVWCFNDSRENPVADYPEYYSGKIAYICEFK